MKKIKILIAYGTRPELLKLVTLIKLIQKQPDFDLFLVSTGQHKEMLQEIESTFQINPSVNFNIMQKDQSLNDIMINISKLIGPYLKNVKPDLAIVQGDTSTASTIAMNCFYENIPVGHVEAGLRSFNLNEPFPEEFNRKLITTLATINFTPTVKASNNLIKEGVPSNSISLVGNTIVDLVNYVKLKFLKNIPFDENLILVTAHRRENHGEGIYNICRAIKELLKQRPNMRFIWPVHPNPNILSIVHEELGDVDNVQLSEPLTYIELSTILNSCCMIWTDSGGIQEEAPSYKKPVLILRNVTERPEVVESGFGKLVGTSSSTIVNETINLLDNRQVFESILNQQNPFGDGDSANKIVEIIRRIKL
jgi:UDP-N-acetylglucosamine 2-epimerase (non-hydrolysing)